MSNQGTSKTHVLDTTTLNEQYFRNKHGKAFVEGSPHLAHEDLRNLCTQLMTEALFRLSPPNESPCVLDVGAGDGALTLPLLARGAKVVAVDASGELLSDLKIAAMQHGDSLEAVGGDVSTALDDFGRNGRRFDLVCASSFLHHLPDYPRMC